MTAKVLNPLNWVSSTQPNNSNAADRPKCYLLRFKFFAAADLSRYAESDRLAIEANELNRTLFLAVRLDVY